MPRFVPITLRAALPVAWVASIAVVPSVVSPPALVGQVRASERGTVTQGIAGTEIVIDYSRPSVRGRDSIFGKQVHWGDVWTPGADQSTTIRVSKDFSLNGHKIAAGTYGLWMQPQPDGQWTVMLHRDTTLYHAPHPSLDDGFLTFPVIAETVEDFKETLAFDIQRVRATGADIQMHWANTRVSIHIGVDPGFAIAVDAEEAALLVGEWTLQRVQTQPDSVVARWKAEMSPEDIADFDRYYAPTPIEFRYEPDTGRLLVFETRPDDDDTPDFLMLPRGAGIYAQGYLMQGELAFAARNPSFWEFEFDENGTALSFTIRRSDDTAVGHGRRDER